MYLDMQTTSKNRAGEQLESVGILHPVAPIPDHIRRPLLTRPELPCNF
jgi:hypothetical protein